MCSAYSATTAAARCSVTLTATAEDRRPARTLRLLRLAKAGGSFGWVDNPNKSAREMVSLPDALDINDFLSVADHYFFGLREENPPTFSRGQNGRHPPRRTPCGRCRRDRRPGAGPACRGARRQRRSTLDDPRRRFPTCRSCHRRRHLPPPRP